LASETNKSEWALICPKEWNQRILLLISENHNSNITTFKVRFFPSDNCNQFWHVCLMQSPLFNFFYPSRQREICRQEKTSDNQGETKPSVARSNGCLLDLPPDLDGRRLLAIVMAGNCVLWGSKQLLGHFFLPCFSHIQFQSFKY
jgi:hypothetical protein